MAGQRVVARTIEARRLRSRGATWASIARHLGVSPVTVRRWIDPEFRERCYVLARRWRERNHGRTLANHYRYTREERDRGTCTSCGGPMGLGYDRDGVCRDCQLADQYFRRCDIQRMWNKEGLTARQIGKHMDRTKVAMDQEIVRMRRDGWWLKPRNPARCGMKSPPKPRRPPPPHPLAAPSSA